MSECLVCQIVDGKIPSKKIYEDDDILAILDVNGANPGHCFVMPKRHHTIFEQIPDQEVSRLFKVSNKVSSAIFESLNAHGTNIFIANGIPAGQTVAHFMIHVIPRTEGDGINLQWKPKQMEVEEISTIEVKLKDAAEHIYFEKKEPEKKTAQPVMPKLKAGKNHLMKYFEKVP